MAADFERTVMEHYQITSLTPEVWPEEKNNSEASEGEDEEASNKKAKLNRRKSRYQALERAASNRSSVIPGSEKTANGIGNLVQRDEPDPLGTTDSVVRTLKQYGVPLQDDPRLRNRFLLSSTTFSPALFLSQMHATADTNQLLMGLDALSQSIDQKSASLKVLVESNFERFVRAKATIDNVYKEMKYRGAEPPAQPSARARAHSRHASRNSFRAGSGNINLTAPLTPQGPDPRKKNALIKESEYGVTGIKTPLLDVAAKAEGVWGPALGGQEREENLKTVANSLGRFGEYVETSAAIADSIKRKDHESLIEEYSKARRFADEARRIAQQLGTTPPSDSQLYQILLAARMWHDVEEQISAFKRTVWRRLSAPHNVSKSEGPGQPQDQHMELISLLLELGAEDNPIYFWLLSRYDNLKGKIQSYADRTKVEIELLRRRLSSSERPAPRAIGSYLRALGRQSIDSRPTNYDAGNVIELWEKMLLFLNTFLSPQGILAEVVEFWQTIQGFLDGKIQRSLPTGYNGESLVHHQLSEDWASNLQRGTVELVEMVREHVFIFFAGPPPEDISLLFSPLPLSPKTPMSTSLSGALSPSAYRDPRFNLDPSNPPPPSPKRGEAWEKFAFWPPWSNSVSAVHYLSKMLALVGSGASEMAAIAPVGLGDGQELELLKTLVNVSRERCVVALCAAWNRDAETIKHVEDWNRAAEDRDVTKMPACFLAFEGTLLAGMQKILYVSEASTKPGAEDIVTAPPTKLLQMVRSQYVTTLYKALSGMVENAERSVKKSDDEWTTDPEVVGATGTASSRVTSLRMSSGTTSSSISIGSSTINAGDRNVRMLLTLSNLQRLRSDLVPSLNTQFENAFSVKLTDETKTIRDVLGQIDARLFQSYTRPSIETLRGIIRTGVTAADWAPANGAKPREARPYVYEVLLTLVLVHSQVSTTAASLTTQVLSYLLEQTSRELLEAFKTRPRYDLSTLLQAALDVEFAAQTLQHYTTQRAKDLQNQIYQEIESRSDRDAVLNMQNELPELRSLLKRLRDASKNEFACFKKVRRSNSAEPERKDSL